MAEIKFTISPAPGVLYPFIAVIYKSTAPTAEVDRIVLNDDHSTPQNLQFSNLVDGNYLVVIYNNPTSDELTLGTIRHDFWQDAVTGALLEEPIFITGGGAEPNDPAIGQSDYVNVALDGKTIKEIFQEGFRPLWDAIEWEPLAGGGIRLLTNSIGDPLYFQQDVVYRILVQSTVLSSAPTANDAFSTIVTESDDFNVGDAHWNNTVLVSGGLSKTIASLPFLAGIADGKGVIIQHDGGTPIYIHLKAKSGEIIRFRSEDKNIIYLAKGEFIKLLKFGTKWYVKEFCGKWDLIGSRNKTDGTQPINTLPEVGGWYLKTDYARLYLDYVSQLDIAEIVAGTDDVTPATGDKAKWNVGSTKFWVPDRGGYFDRNADPDGNIDPGGVRISGDIENDLVKAAAGLSMDADMIVKTGAHSSSSTAISGGEIRFLVNTLASIGNTATAKVNITGTGGTGTGSETRPKNAAIYSYVNI